jgi:hypothetical protein
MMHIKTVEPLPQLSGILSVTSPDVGTVHAA